MLTPKQKAALECAGRIIGEKAKIHTGRGVNTPIGMANLILSLMTPDEKPIESIMIYTHIKEIREALECK